MSSLEGEVHELKVQLRSICLSHAPQAKQASFETAVVKAIEGVPESYWERGAPVTQVYKCSTVAVKLLQAMRGNTLSGRRPSVDSHISRFFRKQSRNDQFLIAGKILEATVFILSRGNSYDHLNPLKLKLQIHLDARNGHAHDGSFLQSFVLHNWEQMTRMTMALTSLSPSTSLWSTSALRHLTRR